MALQLSTTTRNAMADAITTAIGSGAFVRVYNGTPPANVAASLSGNTLLAELTNSGVFAPSASNGTLTADAITQDSSANANGTASFFRVDTSANATIAQGNITTSGGGGDMELSSTTIVSGGQVSITAFTITIGGA